MSLIEEALRRAQEALSRPPPRVSIQPSQPAKVQPERPGRSTNLNPWVGFALAWGALSLLVLGLVTGALWTYRVMVASKPITVSLPSSHPSGQGQRADLAQVSPPAPFVPVALSEVGALPSEPVVHESLPPELELNGVVEGAGEPFVIINGRIVRLGETVEGATLLEVRRDSARLRWREQELVLRTTR